MEKYIDYDLGMLLIEKKEYGAMLKNKNGEEIVWISDNTLKQLKEWLNLSV